MSIDEAIEHEREIVNCCKNEISTFPNPEPYEKYCNGELEKRADEHEQLAKWLEELKTIKQYDLDIPQHFTKEQIRWIKNYCIQKNKEFYKQGIDDFENKILSNCSGMLKDGDRVIVIRMDIFKFILEQLKAGGKNE